MLITVIIPCTSHSKVFQKHYLLLGHDIDIYTEFDKVTA